MHNHIPTNHVHVHNHVSKPLSDALPNPPHTHYDSSPHHPRLLYCSTTAHFSSFRSIYLLYKHLYPLDYTITFAITLVVVLATFKTVAKMRGYLSPSNPFSSILRQPHFPPCFSIRYRHAVRQWERHWRCRGLGGVGVWGSLTKFVHRLYVSIGPFKSTSRAHHGRRLQVVVEDDSTVICKMFGGQCYALHFGPPSLSSYRHWQVSPVRMDRQQVSVEQARMVNGKWTP